MGDKKSLNTAEIQEMMYGLGRGKRKEDRWLAQKHPELFDDTQLKELKEKDARNSQDRQND